MVMLKRKLQSRRGASMLFALLAFLVASVVSVTLVSAAVTNVKRVRSDHDAQQAHLTLASAAQLVRDEMANTKYVTTVTDTTVVVQKTDTGAEISRDSSTMTDKSAYGTFGTEVGAAVPNVDTLGADYAPVSPVFQIRLDGIDTVSVSLVMKANSAEDTTAQYNLIFTFTIEGSEEMMVLTMKSKQTDSTVTTEDSVEDTENHTTTITTTVTSTTVITWVEPYIGTAGG